MNTIISKSIVTIFFRKSAIALIAMTALHTIQTDAQNIGLNVPNPTSPIHIHESPGTTLGHLEPILNVEYAGVSVNGESPVAIKGTCTPNDLDGIGGMFVGNKYGIAGFGHGNGSNTFGVYGFATGYSLESVGVFGSAVNGDKNWAGYFGGGNVYVTNLLGIGQENPIHAIDILKPQAVMRFQSTSHANGSVIDLRNTSSSPNLLGAINFATGSSTPGQISYLVSDWLTFRAGGAERMRIGAQRIGINHSNPSAPVHIKEPAGVQLGENEPVVYVEYTGENNFNAIAIKGRSQPIDYFGIGGSFEGGAFGVKGRSAGTSSALRSGVQGVATGPGLNSGVEGYAYGPGTNYAVYGFAFGEGVCWAGYFQGNVFAEGLGVGRTPVTNILEIEGQASKSSAGDWIANSDARLKKDITQLDPEEMIRKLLSLQGVTYEWNDTVTGSYRPEGIQYGFTAQNIQQAFPTLVETDRAGYLQTAYGTYDPMMVEAIRYLYLENKALESRLDALTTQLESAVPKNNSR